MYVREDEKMRRRGETGWAGGRSEHEKVSSLVRLKEQRGERQEVGRADRER